jgi:hypothetical protein
VLEVSGGFQPQFGLQCTGLAQNLALINLTCFMIHSALPWLVPEPFSRTQALSIMLYSLSLSSLEWLPYRSLPTHQDVPSCLKLSWGSTMLGEALTRTTEGTSWSDMFTGLSHLTTYKLHEALFCHSTAGA